MNNFLRDNALQLIAFVAMLVGAYSEYQILLMRVDVLESRLDKKIKLINDLDKRMDRIELKINK